MKCELCSIEAVEMNYLQTPAIKKTHRGIEFEMNKLVCCNECLNRVQHNYISNTKVLDVTELNSVDNLEPDNEISEENIDDGFAEIENIIPSHSCEARVDNGCIPPSAENTRPMNPITEEI